jgi:hypothetical protein
MDLSRIHTVKEWIENLVLTKIFPRAEKGNVQTRDILYAVKCINNITRVLKSGLEPAHSPQLARTVDVALYYIKADNNYRVINFTSYMLNRHTRRN